MSNRKQRSRSAEVASDSRQQQQPPAEGQPATPRPSPQPPQRNVALLSVSVVAFLIWIAFLIYAALFG